LISFTRQFHYRARQRLQKSAHRIVCVYVTGRRHLQRTCVVMEMPLRKKTLQIESVVKKRIHLLIPSIGNSSTNPVTTVSISTICVYRTQTHSHALIHTDCSKKVTHLVSVTTSSLYSAIFKILSLAHSTVNLNKKLIKDSNIVRLFECVATLPCEKLMTAFEH